MTVLDRLSDKFTVGDGCWLWKSTAERDTYGRFWDGTRLRKAYAFVYELLVGPVPEGLELDHLCRHQACVNPGHLEPVPHQVNCQRAADALDGFGGARHWRGKTHCPQGHPYDEENTYHRPGGGRSCRICNRTKAAVYQRRKRHQKFGTVAP